MTDTNDQTAPSGEPAEGGEVEQVQTPQPVPAEGTQVHPADEPTAPNPEPAEGSQVEPAPTDD